MSTLTEVEQQYISGGAVNVLVPIDPNAKFNFRSGLNASVNMIGGLAGFAIGLPCAIVILPARGIYSLGRSTFNCFS